MAHLLQWALEKSEIVEGLGNALAIAFLLQRRLGLEAQKTN